MKHVTALVWMIAMVLLSSAAWADALPYDYGALSAKAPLSKFDSGANLRVDSHDKDRHQGREHENYARHPYRPSVNHGNRYGNEARHGGVTTTPEPATVVLTALALAALLLLAYRKRRLPA